jgi:hypothetical protein
LTAVTSPYFLLMWSNVTVAMTAPPSRRVIAGSCIRPRWADSDEPRTRCRLGGGIVVPQSPEPQRVDESASDAGRTPLVPARAACTVTCRHCRTIGAEGGGLRHPPIAWRVRGASMQSPPLPTSRRQGRDGTGLVDRLVLGVSMQRARRPLSASPDEGAGPGPWPLRPGRPLAGTRVATRTPGVRAARWGTRGSPRAGFAGPFAHAMCGPIAEGRGSGPDRCSAHGVGAGHADGPAGGGSVDAAGGPNQSVELPEPSVSGSVSGAAGTSIRGPPQWPRK